jgi:mannose-1-phosphate guanylyltransferase
MKKYGVIMAGGGGTRFWPLSRQKTPKQLLNLTGKELMVNEAVDRLAYVADKEDIFIVTNATQVEAMAKATVGRITPNHILSEPSARNTAACVGYAAMEIVKKYGDGVMVITPSDAYIKDTATFTRTLAEAVKVAEYQDKLVTIGIAPTFPATGYGYIKFDKTQDLDTKTVSEFKEKPDEKIAKEYFESGEYAWNSGMFVWKASVILSRFEKLIPDIYADLETIGNAMGKENEYEVINEVYPNIRKISIDYAVMEPAAANGDVCVVPGEFGWSDVGSWDMMGVLHESDENGNIILGDTVSINTTNSILYSRGRMIATVGVDNLIVVATSDAVLVCNKDKAQDVKLIVDTLNEAERKELL